MCCRLQGYLSSLLISYKIPRIRVLCCRSGQFIEVALMNDTPLYFGHH